MSRPRVQSSRHETAWRSGVGPHQPGRVRAAARRNAQPTARVSADQVHFELVQVLREADWPVEDEDFSRIWVPQPPGPAGAMIGDTDVTSLGGGLRPDPLTRFYWVVRLFGRHLCYRSS
jgi:hypothetical protein